MQVQKVLTPQVERIPPDTPIREAAQRMKEKDVGAIPIFDGDRLIGMVTDRDIAIRCIGDGRTPDAPVRDIMTEGIEYCFEDEDTEAVARHMRDKQIRRLVVVNHDKRLVGIVSLGDLAQAGADRAAKEALEGVTAPGH